MATSAKLKRIVTALKDKGLRSYVGAIDDNPATPGEVVLWMGDGHPVYSVREAVELVQALKAARAAFRRDTHPAMHTETD